MKEKLENIGKDLKEIVGKIKTMFVDEKRDFFKIATKALAAFLFYIGLMLPFYSGRVFGANVRVSMFIMDIWFIYFFGILGFILTYLYFAFKSKDKEANKVYKIQTIVIIVMYLRFLLSYILDSSDSLVTTKIGLGFFLTTIALALLILLTWKEDLVLNFVYKFLKLPEKNKLEEVNSEIKEENDDGVEVEMNAEEKV